MLITKIGIIHLLALILMSPIASYADQALGAFSRLDRAGLVTRDDNGKFLISKQAELPLIPASTTKLATAWLALTHWGADHRFVTPFYLDEKSQTLWVKGSGDPYLVSEELDLIARSLKKKGLTQIKAIGIDSSLFQPDLLLPGTGTSDNPYDAVPTSVAANFNTVAVKSVGGQIISAEPSTPLTPYAESLARTNKSGELRINTGTNPHNAERYFGELLGAFLQKHGVAVGSQIVFGVTPHSTLFYQHKNSKTLGDILRPMLKYSTNFVANQLILMLSAEHFKRPANADDVKRYMEDKLYHKFGWQGFTFEDGAGLSHNNRISAQQLTDLLMAFRSWKHLLPEVAPGIYAKSGTLTGVSALAGYLVKQGQWQPFAVIMNESVAPHLRHNIARELLLQSSRF